MRKRLGTIYLLHFSSPFKHTKHYTGWASDLDARLTEHRQGRGARLMKVIAEFGITCLSDVGGKSCGAPVIWFDYELGEKEFYKGFVCDEHRVSGHVEKLGQSPTTAAA